MPVPGRCQYCLLIVEDEVEHVLSQHEFDLFREDMPATNGEPRELCNECLQYTDNLYVHELLFHVSSITVYMRDNAITFYRGADHRLTCPHCRYSFLNPLLFRVSFASNLVTIPTTDIYLV